MFHENENVLTYDEFLPLFDVMIKNDMEKRKNKIPIQQSIDAMSCIKRGYFVLKNFSTFEGRHSKRGGGYAGTMHRFRKTYGENKVRVVYTGKGLNGKWVTVFHINIRGILCTD